MTNETLETNRRTVLQAAACLAIGHLALPAASAVAASSPASRGEFEFLAGSWRVSHRQLKKRWVGSNDWVVYAGEATCFTVLGGIASIEELRVPARGFSGVGTFIADDLDGELPIRLRGVWDRITIANH